MPTFTANKPASNETLAVSQPLIMNNLDFLQQTGNVDHTFTGTTGTPPNGYHKLIHMTQQGTPAPVTNTGQLWANASNVPNAGGTQMWYEDNSGVVTQLTNKAGATASAIGHTFLPGGLILQWGSGVVNTSGTPTTFAFEKTFAAIPYSVTISCINNGGNSPSENNVYIKSGGISTTDFTVSNSSSGTITAIYWMAIGTF